MNRKSKHIRQVNLLAERRYLNEQGAPTPTTGTTTPTSPQPVTTTTTTKKVSKDDIKRSRICSGFPKGAIPMSSTGETEDHIIYYDSKGKIFCVDPKEK
jgi:hypothetical protein